MFSGAPTKKLKDETVHTSIEKAYKELSTQGFAVWMRLHVVPPEELQKGRAHIARTLRYSEGRSNAILRELSLKGYVEQDKPKKKFVVSKFTLTRRCKIVGPSAFVRINNVSRALTTRSENLTVEDAGVQLECEPVQQRRGTIFFDCEVEPLESTPFKDAFESVPRRLQERSGESAMAHSLSAANPKRQLETKRNQTKPKQAKVQSAPEETDGDGSMEDFYNSITKTRPTLNAAKESEPSKKRTVQNDDDSWSENVASGGRLVLSKMRDFFQFFYPKTDPQNSDQNESNEARGSNSSDTYIREERKIGKLDLSKIPSREDRRAKRVMNQANLPTHPDVGKPIDWNKFDLNDKPIVSFDPEDAERERMVHLLSSDHRRLTAKERKVRDQIKGKLRQEFVRAYERYRKAALREAGQRTSMYSVMPEEFKYAERAAIACIMRGVTPKQVLQYWHENIGNFADRKMPVPPLPFLSSPANIDRVAIDQMATDSDVLPPRYKGLRAGAPREHSSDSYGDVSLLHPKLRRILIAGGFDLSKVTDKHLVNIQCNAIDVAGDPGEAAFISSGIRDMVRYAAENVAEYKTRPMDYL